ncbi:uncharacterized protein si:ch211-245h14.1 [Esox lucius]|uniref:uncharacterized protein si:ch211-245h14.1 n=1 Tax=Esox lucius TaxID=8010 RepID=UPI001477802A|nr:uncharacterized protein si:ch211-245h14.1 [Esox lucius]
MSRTMLKEQIKKHSPYAESVLTKIGLTNDTDIQDLSREDLNELLPGLEHFKLRKEISQIINKSKQDQAKTIDSILNELKEFLPADVMRSALVPGGVLHGYLPVLKDLKEDLSRALHFFEALIKLLESYNQGKPTKAVLSGVTQSDDATTEGSQMSYAGKAMSRTMLKEQIKKHSPYAESVLTKIGLTNDTDIQDLSREDLNELLPGLEHFKLRKEISQIINKSKQDQAKTIDSILNELKEFLPADVMRSALVPGGVLHGYLPVLKDLKEDLSRALHFFEALIKLLESYNQGKPTKAVLSGVTQSDDATTEGSQTSYAGKAMSRTMLKEQIKKHSTYAESVLTKIGLTNDTDIQDLSREDLNELLPGLEHFKLRKEISQIINKSKQDQAKTIDSILNELKEFLPADVMRSALVPGGVLHGYLPVLKDLKEDLSRALHFFEALIKLLESYNQGKPTKAVLSGVTQSDDATTEGSQTSYAVKVHSRVCGQTLNNHLALMKQVDQLGGGLRQEETSVEDCQVIMVFCPIVSRVGTDIESAMKCIPGNKEVILVLMYHTFDCDLVTCQKSASPYQNIVLEVNVLFHDSKGLLHCETNNKAVSCIHKALQKYKRENSSTK